jgi:hypothetical protein
MEVSLRSVPALEVPLSQDGRDAIGATLARFVASRWNVSGALTL